MLVVVAEDIMVEVLDLLDHKMVVEEEEVHMFIQRHNLALRLEFQVEQL
jgi:hypothetical protein